jgi:hypothetical protein
MDPRRKKVLGSEYGHVLVSGRDGYVSGYILVRENFEAVAIIEAPPHDKISRALNSILSCEETLEAWQVVRRLFQDDPHSAHEDRTRLLRRNPRTEHERR